MHTERVVLIRYESNEKKNHHLLKNKLIYK